jgi:predicted enzyme related to lactoylglutathione lyase
VDHRFVWYDLLTTDLDAAMKFYGDVVGFTHADAGMPGPTYNLLSAGGINVGGALELSDEMCAMGMKPCWLGHIGTDNIDAMLPKLEALGGKVHRGKTPIPGVGHFAVVADPQGAGFHLFEPGPDRPPAQDIPAGTPGKVGWRELLAADWESVWPFYEELFGWKKNETYDMGPMGQYQLWRAYGENPDGGMFTKTPEIPAPFWQYYFVVHGADAAAERIKAGGGQVLMGPHEVPGGGWIVQALDPQGANFAVLSGDR